jgi:hypothetical protein
MGCLANGRAVAGSSRISKWGDVTAFLLRFIWCQDIVIDTILPAI